MPNSNSNEQMSIKDRSYISRDEFEVFEKNVDRSFNDLAKAVSNLSSKIDQMGSTDWKTFGMFAALILTAISLGGSLIVRDFNNLSNSMNKNQAVVSEKFKESSDKIDRIDERIDNIGSTRWTRQDHENYSAIDKEFNRNEVIRLEGLIEKAEKKAQERYEKFILPEIQDIESRLRELEKTVL